VSWDYGFFESINLHVKERISPADAARQEHTARTILARLQSQPGLILADEVGMGKTFVALGVAASVALSDRQKRPVVVMVPPSLKEKWPRDFELFKERCLPPKMANKLRHAQAERGIQFLKLLDDPPEKRSSIIFLTHGAMSAGLTDPWVKLALIQRSLYRKHNTKGLRRILYRSLGKLLMKAEIDRKAPKLWERLLNSDPENWLQAMVRYGVNPEPGVAPDLVDHPVPQTVIEAIGEINTESIYKALKSIPIRQSKHYEEKLIDARREINQDLRNLWQHCLNKIHFKLPLLILDEAHHLKNARTRLASLFQVQKAAEDAEEIKGVLAGGFERMLFLTATPFQLGHHELCSVLERFEGITWKGKTAPPGGLEHFQKTVNQLRNLLDGAQEAAVTLDHAWGQLAPEDLILNGEPVSEVETWWGSILVGTPCSLQAQRVLECYNRVREKMKAAEQDLSPWVIRHIKPKFLPEPYCSKPRRDLMIGAAIFPDLETTNEEGISISGDSLLPFLLAARAVACDPESRPVFAEGLASSYESFLQTRKKEKKGEELLDADDEGPGVCKTDAIGDWYLNRLESFIRTHERGLSECHPKMEATVRRVIDSWQAGEKVLIFCHYIATGRSLRQHISEAVRRKIRTIGSEKLGCRPEEVFEELDRLGDRFFDADSPANRACKKKIAEILHQYPGLDLYKEDLMEIVRRYVRTPTFLIRYFPLGEGRFNEAAIEKAFRTRDGSGQTLDQVLNEFFSFLINKCGKDERDKYILAARGIQTGAYLGAEVSRTYSEDEIQGEKTERLVPNVRLVNGSIGQESRQKLMLTFNTPFYPEIMIASSVMAEGVDLHFCCRTVIHHDLCWNPSTLEQRTGRVDRIGAKIERCGMPLQVFMPYVAETQDEKMYRVVTDRERWFRVIMGEEYRTDYRTTEKLGARIPFPESAANSLAFRLEA
jgi:hypothetical protein